jgi:Fe-S-cluster containining protein
MSPLPRPTDEPWYAQKGLSFRCTACGACCTGAPGYVWVKDADIRRLAKAKGMTPEAFAKLYVRQVGDRLSLKERSNGDCVMLEGRKCSVYDAKPIACSTFPFWDDVVESPASWAESAERCPGMNHGDVYDRGEIATLLRGVPGPLLEKQAAARRATDPSDAPEPVSEATWVQAFADLDAIYADLDRELPRYKFVCQASGDCCDFEAFGHRLYVTTIEAEYFFRNSPQKRFNDDPKQCPAWGADRMCKARTGRMLGCRTFYCGTNKNADPNEIYERYYRRIKDVHAAHGIPFRYADVTAWAAERRPAKG